MKFLHRKCNNEVSLTKSMSLECHYQVFVSNIVVPFPTKFYALYDIKLIFQEIGIVLKKYMP